MVRITGGNVLLDVDFILKKSHIKENMKVADFGCGASGHFVFPASRLVGKRGIVYALDILKTILESINKKCRQENFKNIKTIWSDLEVFKATKIESSSLDMGFLINTLYQSSKRLEILREVIRMIKKNSKLLIVEWKESASPLGPPVEKRVKLDLLKIGLKKLGLKEEEEFEAGQFHYGIIFTKL